MKCAKSSFAILGTLLLASPAYAGLFNVVHFVAPGEFAIGIEPEVTLTNGAGMGFNFKYTQGISDVVNLQAAVGTGTGPREFRIGLTSIFDFFPDTEGQPGIGLGARMFYYQLATVDQLEVQAFPYIHKSFKTKEGDEIEPFFGFPWGYGFAGGNYTNISSANFGGIFKFGEHFRSVFEIGIAVNNTDSIIAGGIAYYH